MDAEEKKETLCLEQDKRKRREKRKIAIKNIE